MKIILTIAIACSILFNFSNAQTISKESDHNSHTLNTPIPINDIIDQNERLEGVKVTCEQWGTPWGDFVFLAMCGNPTNRCCIIRITYENGITRYYSEVNGETFYYDDYVITNQEEDGTFTFQPIIN